jgi:hypothetical protein
MDIVNVNNLYSFIYIMTSTQESSISDIKNDITNLKEYIEENITDNMNIIVENIENIMKNIDNIDIKLDSIPNSDENLDDYLDDINKKIDSMKWAIGFIIFIIIIIIIIIVIKYKIISFSYL